MIEPPPAASIAGISARIALKAPRRFTASTRPKSSEVVRGLVNQGGGSRPDRSVVEGDIQATEVVDGRPDEYAGTFRHSDIRLDVRRDVIAVERRGECASRRLVRAGDHHLRPSGGEGTRGGLADSCCAVSDNDHFLVEAQGHEPLPSGLMSGIQPA
jgi:hypothetical protein